MSDMMTDAVDAASTSLSTGCVTSVALPAKPALPLAKRTIVHVPTAIVFVSVFLEKKAQYSLDGYRRSCVKQITDDIVNNVLSPIDAGYDTQNYSRIQLARGVLEDGFRESWTGILRQRIEARLSGVNVLVLILTSQEIVNRHGIHLDNVNKF